MSDRDLFDAVAQKTDEDSHEIRRRGFVLTGPDDRGPEPECLLDVLLVDLPEAGTVDWDALGLPAHGGVVPLGRLWGDRTTWPTCSRGKADDLSRRIRPSPSRIRP